MLEVFFIVNSAVTKVEKLIQLDQYKGDSLFIILILN